MEKKEKEREKKKKKSGESRKQQVEMVDDQTANKTAKVLKKGKENHQFRNSRITLLVVLVLPLASSLVCMCLPGRFGACIWWCWSPPVAGGMLVRA
jgi:hypothetical protein